MSIKSDLKKDGIEVTQKLDTLKINSIAKNIASKLCQTFSSGIFALYISSLDNFINSSFSFNP